MITTRSLDARSWKTLDLGISYSRNPSPVAPEQGAVENYDGRVRRSEDELQHVADLVAADYESTLQRST
jgi:hypothetical protein